MNRIDVINRLIAKNGYTRYLEIGTATRACFDNVACAQKTCVDPAVNGITYDFNMSSDEFFAQNTQKFDIVFIDGLHSAEQVARDVHNSLQCLNPAGCVVMHDCSPPDERHTNLDLCGTAWRVVYDLRVTRADLTVYTVDTDYGVGVVRKEPGQTISNFNPTYDFAVFAATRKETLGLISPAEFENLCAAELTSHPETALPDTSAAAPIIYVLIPTTKQRRQRLGELVASIQTHTENMRHCIVMYENSDGGWVPAIYNALAGISGYCALLGSDTLVEKDWLKNLWNAFIRAFPAGDGVAEPFNEIHGDRLCQHPFAHTTTIKKYLYPGYTHWYSDNDFTDQARRDNKLIYVPTARIQHKHAAIGAAPWDETYETVYDPKTVEKDRALYAARVASNYADVCNKLH